MVDQIAFVQIDNIVVHADHAVILSGLDAAHDLMGLALPDIVLNGLVTHHDLASHHSSLVVGPFQQLLRNDAVEDIGELNLDLLLLGRREDVDDSFNGGRRAVGVKRRKDQMSGLSRGEGNLDGLEIPHFSHQNDVRVLPEGPAEGAGEGSAVASDFPLVDDAFVMLVQELDRVLQGDDMGGPAGVDVVDHGGQGGRLARACRAGHKKESAVPHGHVLENIRKVQVLKHGNAEGYGPYGDGDAAPLSESVDPETPFVLQGVGKIDFAFFIKGFLLDVAQEAQGHGSGIFRSQFSIGVQLRQFAVDPENRRHPYGQMDVRGSS